MGAWFLEVAEHQLVSSSFCTLTNTAINANALTDYFEIWHT